MAVKATWLGGPGEPAECEWMGIVFPEGVSVEITDEFMIRKAKGNQFFAVEDDEPEAKPTKSDHLTKARAVKAAKAHAAHVKDIDA